MIQKVVKGKLPSRDNIIEHLRQVVYTYASLITSTEKLFALPKGPKQTDHRMSSQKRLLYGINFPTDKPIEMRLCGACDTISNASGATSSSCLPICTLFQEAQDFKLALQLQHKEMESHEQLVTTEPVPDSGSEADVEFKANTAAALLHFNQRRSK